MLVVVATLRVNDTVPAEARVTVFGVGVSTGGVPAGPAVTVDVTVTGPANPLRLLRVTVEVPEPPRVILLGETGVAEIV